MSAGPRYSKDTALAVARELCEELILVTKSIIIAGSLRREKESVGDIEIVYIPRLSTQPLPQGDLFSDNKLAIDEASLSLDSLIASGVLAKRPNAKGYKIWGRKNKLATHVATGIPVDLFSADEGNWYNYLVCRTGPAALNMRIAEAAKRKGWTWNPYGPGFSTADGRTHKVTSEEDVFTFVGLPYQRPEDRS